MDDKKIKQDLAYAYKILARLGFDDHTYTHLSSRGNDRKSYYIYPFGLLFEEVEPENLIKVDLEGNILEGSEFQYNKTGYIIHGAIYKARSDINSIFHIHTPEIVAVSAQSQGLRPISQWALHFYRKMAYHGYNSLALEDEQGLQLIKDLGENYNMLLKNHGSITSGRTIYEAMFYTYHLQQACRTQCLAQNSPDNLIEPNEEVCKKTVNDLLSFEKSLGERDWQAWVRKFIK